MKSRMIQAVVILASLGGGCHKDDDNDKGHSTPPPRKPDSSPAPVVVLGLNSGLAAGSIAWTLPEFLKGQFKDLDKADAEAAVNIDLRVGVEKRTVRVNTGISVKPCGPVDETKSFISTVAKPTDENAPNSHKIDVDEVSSWTTESKNFEGRLFLRKSYKSEGDTGIYRIDALVTNTKLSECVLWNLVFTPDTSTSAKFIESSDRYKDLMTSLSVTWKDMGTDFDE